MFFFFFFFSYSAVCLRSAQLFGVFLFEIEFSETRGCTRWFSSSFHSFPVWRDWRSLQRSLRSRNTFSLKRCAPISLIQQPTHSLLSKWQTRSSTPIQLLIFSRVIRNIACLFVRNFMFFFFLIQLYEEEINFWKEKKTLEVHLLKQDPVRQLLLRKNKKIRFR